MNYIPSNAEIIQRIPKSDSAPYGCVTVNQVPAQRPALVAFGGELTTNAQAANSYAKMLATLLDENNINDVDVYSVIYKFGSRDAILERAEQFRIAGRRIRAMPHPLQRAEQNKIIHIMRKNEPVPQYVQQLFDILLRPRIVNPDGTKIDTNDAITNIRKIKFYAHCHGASTIWQMANLMHDEMLHIGYSINDIQKIQHELLVIQHSPIAPLTQQKFFTVSFASAEDTMMHHHNNFFADWFNENSADVVPCYFGPRYGNVFIAGRLKALSFKEHDNKGLLQSDEDVWPLTDDGKIIFAAERNAIVRGVMGATNGTSTTNVQKLVDGNGVDFNQLKENGDGLYKFMINDLRQQNSKHGHQK